MIGMTAGAPLGSLIAGELFGLGFSPQVILQISAVLLLATLGLYLVINRREARAAHGRPRRRWLPAAGSSWSSAARTCGSIALLIVLLNVVNTTGEYLIARLLTAHAAALAARQSRLQHAGLHRRVLRRAISSGSTCRRWCCRRSSRRGW